MSVCGARLDASNEEALDVRARALSREVNRRQPLERFLDPSDGASKTGHSFSSTASNARPPASVIHSPGLAVFPVRSWPSDACAGRPPPMAACWALAALSCLAITSSQTGRQPAGLPPSPLSSPNVNSLFTLACSFLPCPAQRQSSFYFFFSPKGVRACFHFLFGSLFWSLQAWDWYERRWQKQRLREGPASQSRWLLYCAAGRTREACLEVRPSKQTNSPFLFFPSAFPFSAGDTPVGKARRAPGRGGRREGGACGGLCGGGSTLGKQNLGAGLGGNFWEQSGKLSRSVHKQKASEGHSK